MTVTKPDATVFDNADDSIATSRAELHTLATSFNTIADDYNAGLLTQSGDAIEDGINVEIEIESAGTKKLHAYGPSHYVKTYNFQTASGGGTTAGLNIPAHQIFSVINTTSGGTLTLTIPVGDIGDWKGSGLTTQRSPHPATGSQEYQPTAGGDLSYVAYLTLIGRDTNTFDATVLLKVNTNSGLQTLDTITLSASEERLYRITVMQDDRGFNADSSGQNFAFVNIEDLTTTATRIETP